MCYVLFIAAGIIACQHDILNLKKLLDNKINNMGYRMIILLMRMLFINLKWREEINFLFKINKKRTGLFLKKREKLKVL